jgi:hypothetical protein
MNTPHLLGLATAGLIAFTPLLAAGEPTDIEIQKVLDFYYADPPGSPIAVEIRVCEGVATEGALKNECQKALSPEAIEVGKAGYLWINFMVPKGADGEKILIQFDHDGITRLTRQVDLSGAIRFRTWKKFSLDRPGKWSVKVLHDRADGVKSIGALKLHARPKKITTASD